MTDLLKLREQKRKRWMTKPTGPSMTLQEYAQDADINVILTRYIKTGVLPQSSIDPNNMQYADVSDFGTYQENYEKVLAAQNHFLQYPAEIREAMSNDPAKMQEFFTDPKNYELLKKHKLFKEEIEPPKPNEVLNELKSLNKNLSKKQKQESSDS